MFILLSLLKGWIFDFAEKFKDPIVFFICGCLVFGTGFLMSKNFWQSGLQKELSVVHAQLKQNVDRAKDAQNVAEAQKAKSESEMKAVKEKLTKVEGDYASLKNSKSISKTAYIKVPTEASEQPKEVEVNIDEKGEVVCSQFPIEFQESVNKMIEEGDF